jgi:hemin uptake protein HemP
MEDRNAKASSWPASPAREVWYGYAGDELRVLWYRYTLLSTDDGTREARVWAGYTERNGKERFSSREFGTGAVTTTDEPFSLDIAGNELTSGSASGSLDDIEWDLTWAPDDVTFTPLRNRLLTTAIDRISGTGRHWSVNGVVRVNGTVTVDGEEIEFTNAAGTQGHTVGALPTECRWMQCGAFPDPTVSIEALSIGGRVSVCFRHNGQVYLLNRVQDLYGPFANVTEYDRPGHWSFRAAGDGVKLSVMVRADPNRWQRVLYRTPDGERYNAHCSLSTVRLKYEYDDQVRTIESSGGRAEWVGTEPPVDGDYRMIEE